LSWRCPARYTRKGGECFGGMPGDLITAGSLSEWSRRDGEMERWRRGTVGPAGPDQADPQFLFCPEGLRCSRPSLAPAEEASQKDLVPHSVPALLLCTVEHLWSAPASPSTVPLHSAPHTDQTRQGYRDTDRDTGRRTGIQRHGSSKNTNAGRSWDRTDEEGKL
jgi:hypothetical protein